MKRLGFTLIPLIVSVPLFAQSWPQWAQNQQHTGFLNVAGQNPNRILANIVYDPLVPQEQALNEGELLVHYETPLVDGNDVYMESKAGSYTKGAYNTETWHQNKFSWVNGQLTNIWTFDSDWVAPGGQADFWEPVYHAALANGALYDPGAGGSIFKIDKSSGTALKRIVSIPGWSRSRLTTPFRQSATPRCSPVKFPLPPIRATSHSVQRSSLGRRVPTPSRHRFLVGFSARPSTSLRPSRLMARSTRSRVGILSAVTVRWWPSIPISL